MTESRPSAIGSVFLPSVIHAAEAAATGWTAKRIPASHAPGTFSLRSARQTSTAAAAWSSTLTAWYPAALAPQSRHSIQSIVDVSGK